MKFKQLLLLMFPLGVFAGTAHAATPTVDLTGIGFVTYGDALSYSMPFAQFQVSGNAKPSPGDPFYIKSTAGEIKDLIVVATGATGQDVTTNFTGMDNAYSTPSGQNGQNFFQTGGLTFSSNLYPATDPDYSNPNATLPPQPFVPEFHGDKANTWDATLASMQTFLDGYQMVFFFNNNQLNSTDAEQSLGIWAQAWITDPFGNTVPLGAETGYFEVTNRTPYANPLPNNGQASPYALFTEGGGGVPLGDPTLYSSAGRTAPGAYGTDVQGRAITDYILSGGGVCLDAFGAPVSCSSPSAVVGPVNHNLGADNAAYAVVIPELNALMGGLFAAAKLDPAYDLNKYTLHLDIRMGCDPTLFGSDPNADICDGGSNDWGKNLNNGYEQIFIGRAVGAYQVPEPATLALLGMGLFGLGMARRRRG